MKIIKLFKFLYFFLWKYLLRIENKNHCMRFTYQQVSPNLYKPILIIKIKIRFRGRSVHMILPIITYKCHRIDEHNYYSDDADFWKSLNSIIEVTQTDYLWEQFFVSVFLMHETTFKLTKRSAAQIFFFLKWL